MHVPEARGRSELPEARTSASKAFTISVASTTRCSMRLSERDYLALEEYIEQLLVPMGLAGWSIELKRWECEADALAHIHQNYGHRSAEISVSWEFREFDADKVRYVLVHELVHAHGSFVDMHCGKDLGKMLGSAAHEAWRSGYEQLRELEVDAIAHAWAPSLPAFAWPSGFRVLDRGRAIDADQPMRT